MANRLVSATVGFPILILIVWVGSVWFSLFVAVVAATGALELCAMARDRGRWPVGILAAIWAIALIAGAHFTTTGDGTSPSILAATFLIGVVLVGTAIGLTLVVLQSSLNTNTPHWGITGVAFIYPSVLLAYAPFIRVLDDGFLWILLLLGTVFTTDTAGFFVGRQFGKNHIAPRISPGKTWEGTGGGIFGAGIACVILSSALKLPVPYVQAVGLGIAIGVVAVLGDLLESMLKRVAGAKDSGWLVPGHGGLLDRLDSIVFNLPLIYHSIVWMVQ